jgi:hypothetical protein
VNRQKMNEDIDQFLDKLRSIAGGSNDERWQNITGERTTRQRMKFFHDVREYASSV